MDELETRISALEMVLLEVLPFMDPGAVDDGLASIRSGLAMDIGDEERVIRQTAIRLLEQAQDRYRITGR